MQQLPDNRKGKRRMRNFKIHFGDHSDDSFIGEMTADTEKNAVMLGKKIAAFFTHGWYTVEKIVHKKTVTKHPAPKKAAHKKAAHKKAATKKAVVKKAAAKKRKPATKKAVKKRSR
jgi:hypothetical protein